MPRTKFQSIIFGLLMSYTMAMGMEIYNIAVKMGFSAVAGGFSAMTNAVFPAALSETVYMGALVFIFSNLWGNRLGQRVARRYCEEFSDKPLAARLFRQAGTILIMCPTMSLAASILFNLILGGAEISQLPAIWIGTTLKNFPMAFFWNMFGAAPLTHKLFSLLFKG